MPTDSPIPHHTAQAEPERHADVDGAHGSPDEPSSSARATTSVQLHLAPGAFALDATF